MSEKVAAIAIDGGQIATLAKKMLTYRWVCYGMLLLTYIFVYFDRVAPAVVAPELMKEFGLTATSLGILSSMYFYPYAAMQIPSGILSDYLGPRISVGTFFIIAAIGTALFGYSTELWGNHFRTLPDGCGGGGCMDSLYADPGQLVPTQRVLHFDGHDANLG